MGRATALLAAFGGLYLGLYWVDDAGWGISLRGMLLQFLEKLDLLPSCR